jgi:hypothetical protein
LLPHFVAIEKRLADYALSIQKAKDK